MGLPTSSSEILNTIIDRPPLVMVAAGHFSPKLWESFRGPENQGKA